MRRLFKGFFFSLLGLLVLLVIFAFVFPYYAGQDLEKLDVQQSPYSFSAQRDENGVWEIELEESGEESLWFALGYIHSHDRDFQTEALRRLATGRAAEIFGKKILGLDRLMRQSSHLARWEWEQAEEGSLVRRATQAYVAGRNHFKMSPDSSVAPEWNALKLNPSEFDDWEPWEVLAITRFQIWRFSYNLSQEIRHYAMKEYLPGDWAAMLYDGRRLKGEKSLYQRPGIQKHKKTFSFSSKTPAPMWESSGLQTSLKNKKLPPWMIEARLGASNAWLMLHRPRAIEATLCNDPHLGLSFPSPLYPFKYHIKNRVRGAGFALAGQPVMVIGSVQRLGADQKAQSALSWGITLANYANLQDLVQLKTSTQRELKTQREVFRWKEAKEGTEGEEIVEERWSSFGPVVDEMIDWYGAKSPTGVALDWIGYRKLRSPMEFFLRRNLYAEDSLRKDLVEKFPTPSVNFHWIESNNEGQRLGHMVTGLLFKDPRPRTSLDFISEDFADQRTFSYPHERPYVELDAQKTQSFHLVSGNQQVWTEKISELVAPSWYLSFRADRIFDGWEQSVNEISQSQTDYYSPVMARFLEYARGRVASNRLCSQGDSKTLALCQQLVALIDSWDRRFTMDSQAATLSALWLYKVKEALWGGRAYQLNENHPKKMKLFAQWARSSASDRILLRLFEDASTEKKFKTILRESVEELLVRGYQEAFFTLQKHLGPPSNRWDWGNFHRIRWRHPLMSVLGDPPPALGQSVPGGMDSPGHAHFEWRPDRPLEFPATHGSVMRLCSSLGPENSIQLRWSNLTGSSGNPFSKWAWKFADDYYFQGKLYRDDYFR